MKEIKLDIDKERAIKYVLKGALHKERIVFVRELLQNALDAIISSKNKKILIDYDGKKQLLSISDFGIGISENDVIKNGTLRTLFYSKKDEKHRGRIGLGFFTVAPVSKQVVIESLKDGFSPPEIIFTFEHDGKECVGCSISTKEGNRKENGTIVKCFLDREFHGYSDEILEKKIREICKFINPSEAKVYFQGNLINEGLRVPPDAIPISEKDYEGFINFYEAAAYPHIKLLLRELFVGELDSPIKHIKGIMNILTPTIPVTIGRTQLLETGVEDQINSLIIKHAQCIVEELNKKDKFTHEEREFLFDYARITNETEMMETLPLFEDIYGEVHSLKELKEKEIAFGQKDVLHDTATQELGIITIKNEPIYTDFLKERVPEKQILSDSVISAKLEELMKEFPFKMDNIDKEIKKAAEEIINFLGHDSKVELVKRPYSSDEGAFNKFTNKLELNVTSGYYATLREATKDKELLKNALSWLTCHELAHKVATHGDVKFEEEMQTLLENFYRKKVEELKVSS